MEPCTCATSGFCPRFGKHLTRREWQYCQGTSGLGREAEELRLRILAGESAPPVPPGAPPAAGPGIVKKAVGLMKAVAQHVLGGGRTVGGEILAQRIALCLSCDQLDQSRGKQMRCKKCGCEMAIKAEWAEQACPLGKWEAVP